MSLRYLEEIKQILASAGTKPVSDSGLEHVQAEVEEVVGVCSDEVKALWAEKDVLLASLADFIARVEDDLARGKRSPKHNEWLGEVYLTKQKINVLEGLIWTELLLKYPVLRTKEYVAIRKGHQIACSDKASSACKTATVVTADIVFGAKTEPDVAGRN